mmetsp:Transcript_39761/g.100198  ORF Transcript_39761/g.100198 Transcript_39761/m.100198 type:complete len:271 (-) Transcript_39761:117-929(-)|eukprot:CAMPEP_0177644860 /NCGR_PEP_ID=MMETSP0447-20121125/8925_1 /TAXON_ID=0 /ORGANISM="Stygamoeba regulata, Strain BSH-02190019" /LENGTH=270 /DNA_ID=CAMNT_0019147273 /DNA_START=37 /DNA_END=849 /DNA_ORIENTATION=+
MANTEDVKLGFSFDLSMRNERLQKMGLKAPTAMKTGTTICGLIFKDGVVLGADTRATNGPTVADKNCKKIHYIAPTIYCCGAGTAADTENVTDMISSQLRLHSLANNRKARVITAQTLLAEHLFRYQGHVSAALVLGGVDFTGPHLCHIYPEGSSQYLPYVTMGSGSLAAMAVLEEGYEDNLEEDKAVLLVRDAIRAGIFNDMGSGSNVDICVIRKDGVSMMRNYETPNERLYRRAGGYTFPRGFTPVNKTEIEKLVEVTTTIPVEAMEM